MVAVAGEGNVEGEGIAEGRGDGRAVEYLMYQCVPDQSIGLARADSVFKFDG